MLNQDFVDELSARLRDDNVDKPKAQWTQSFLQKAMGAAFSALVGRLPQAYMIRRTLTLALGTEQTIDEDLTRIVHIDKNVCPDTGAFTRAITKADFAVLDKAAPNWRQDETRGYIIHYGVDAIDENKFEVWPPAGEARGEEPLVPAVPTDPGPVSPPVVTLIDNNRIFQGTPTSATLLGGGLQMNGLGTTRTQWGATANAQTLSAGKYIWQVVADDAGEIRVGVVDGAAAGTVNGFGNMQGSVGFSPTAAGVNAISYITPANSFAFMDGPAYGDGDVITVKLDIDSLTVGFIVNNGPEATLDLTLVGSFAVPANNLIWEPGFQARAGGILTAVFDEPTITANLGGPLPTDYQVFDAPGVTQVEVDAYNALLTIYNDALAANQAWQLLPNGEQIRGVFTKTPCLIAAHPVVPAEPVDPGVGAPQVDIDAYNVLLAEYNAAVAADIESRMLYTAVTDDYPLDKAHWEEMMEYGLYYCYSRDDEQTANSSRAAFHLGNFKDMMKAREITVAAVKQTEDSAE